jgi:NAD-dependent dihydropyrimidine dehydrogenase PreA subunit
MAIERIDPRLCIGCGLCFNSCPADVIRMDSESKKAVPKYPEDCVLCFWCLSECPVNAIVMTQFKTAPLMTSWG